MPTRLTNLNLKTAVVSGASAGDVTVTGIEAEDTILGVMHIKGDGTQLTAGSDLTTEFSVASDDTINNDGGTASTNGILLVLYLDHNAS